MTFEAIIVLVLLALILALLAFVRGPSDAVFIGGLTALLIVPVPIPGGWKFGVLSASDAIAGFSNPGLLTVAFLFVVVAGLQETGAIDWIAEMMLGRPSGLRRALSRLIFPVAAMSTFLNNTPVVAMMIPAVSDWSRRLQLQPSKLMIPLSYATILGGTCSLIGTSTNLVVAGLITANTNLPPIRMFDIAWVGIPTAAIGLLFLLSVGPWLLPGTASAASKLRDPREYTAEMIVPVASSLAGKSIEAAGLRHLPGSYIIEIERAGYIISAPGPEQVLQGNDRLIFAGVVDSIRELHNLRGLIPATNQVFKLNSPRHDRQLFEAAVSDTCPLVGKTVREGRFRNRYNAVILAVARNGERIRGKIGDIALRPGDTLLVEGNRNFATQQRDSRDFFLVRSIEDSAPRRHERAPAALAILAGMVMIVTGGWTDMLSAAMAASCLMVLTRCCSVNDARRRVDWPVLIVIGAALGIGKAIEQSGLGGALAETVIQAAGQDPWLALAAVYAVTVLVTEIMTNNAAVALVFPIALATAQQLNLNFMPFAMAIMMAGSASFATPFGYQTNLMVYGPGGYRFSDYLKIGVPISLLVGLVAVILIPLIWPLAL